MGKRKRERAEAMQAAELNPLPLVVPPLVRESDEPVKKKIADMKNCNKCIYFKNCKDLYIWVANVKGGPSIKFHIRTQCAHNEGTKDDW
ncbi:ribosome biogenesis protein BRX1-like [Portunus trituberculatus]|uniref:ribosome biogenesis protein BRX1-like n=1 Tax=Portunus trituberculatus TaxID=210409 RepID=UPI001E1D0884|nr:ribosome biogenesis protein BRX1-like [Portunus trituberculatus]